MPLQHIRHRGDDAGIGEHADFHRADISASNAASICAATSAASMA